MGRERPVIFNEERFTKPYLELRKDTAVVDLSLSLPKNDEHLKKAFGNHYQESTSRDILSSNGQTKMYSSQIVKWIARIVQPDARDIQAQSEMDCEYVKKYGGSQATTSS
ncbi:MAG: hypothetical protein M3Y53_01685 [Thermoproteota archaeon]|nr:hypothetical protein [Thermoproteota archaeon]